MSETLINEWIKDNKLLAKQYQKENYKVIDTECKSNRCIIFFSGNGLYFPNDAETFEKRVIRQNRYEWENVASSKKIMNFYSRIIFVRDIYKQWYVKGISQQISSIAKLKTLLEELTAGMEIICVGNSSGGYMSALMGMELGAKRVFDFSGQFSLEAAIKQEENEMLRSYSEDDACKKYKDLVPMLKEGKTIIYYFYPALCSQDIVQNELVSKYLEKTTFAFKEAEHGKTVMGANYDILFTMQDDKLAKKCVVGKQWSAIKFMLATGGIIQLLKALFQKVVRKLKSR